MPEKTPLYAFVDESGNFDFSLKGTRFYTISAIITQCPWEKVEQITALYFDILSGEKHDSLDGNYLNDKLCHHFHATEDKQLVRDSFFEIIRLLQGVTAYSIVVRKNKTHPSIRDPRIFYSKMVGYLMNYVIKRYQFSKITIFVDGVPVNKDRKAFRSAIKSQLKRFDTPFKIYFPSSSSNSYLQICDYINWAIYRKWEKSDVRSYELIQNLLGKQELDIFLEGDTQYY